MGRERRIGDTIDIPGDYQYRVLYQGFKPQRFWHHTKLIEAQRWLNPQPGEVILDVGCGSGVLSALLADTPKTTVIGIDSNPNAIKFANGFFIKDNLTYLTGLVDELELSDESIGKIAFLEVIEHINIHQARHTIREFYRILRFGGRLVVTTPNAKSLWPLIEWSLDRLRLVPHMTGDQHVMLFDVNLLNNICLEVGFDLITCRTINWIAPWFAQINWNLALKLHSLEQIFPHKFGNIILACFEKKW